MTITETKKRLELIDKKYLIDINYDMHHIPTNKRIMILEDISKSNNVFLFKLTFEDGMIVIETDINTISYLESL